jgi:hypothetical protein
VVLIFPIFDRSYQASWLKRVGSTSPRGSIQALKKPKFFMNRKLEANIFLFRYEIDIVKELAQIISLLI